MDIKPIAIAQQSKSGLNLAPTILQTCWGNQYTGLTWPDIMTGQPPITSVSLLMQLIEATETSYFVNQQVTVAAPTPGVPLPSEWTPVEVNEFTGVYDPGDTVAIPLVPQTIMGAAGWGIVLHQAGDPRTDNLRTIPASVRLVVSYGEGEPDPPIESHDYVYTIHRDFVSGDTVTLEVVNGDREIAFMKVTVAG